MADAAVSTKKRSLQKVMLGDSNQVISASLATTKRLRSSTVADLPCQVCGKLSKSSVVARGAQSNAPDGSPLDSLNKNCTLPVAPRSGVVVCEACKKFCSRFATRISGSNGGAKGSDAEEWMTKCGCRKLARTEDGQPGDFDQTSILDRNLADMCRWCRFRRCHSLGLVVDNEVKASLKGPIDLHSVPCAVCAAPSSGYHFGVISCEGCKGFYRRTIHHQLENTYMCESNGVDPCDVTTQAGRRCKKCRFSKCTSLGMSLAAIRTGRHSYQLRAETKAHLAQLQSSATESGAPASVAQPQQQQQQPMMREMMSDYQQHQRQLQQTFVTPSSSEVCSTDNSPIGMEMPLDVPVDFYVDDNDDGGVSDAESTSSDVVVGNDYYYNPVAVGAKHSRPSSTAASVASDHQHQQLQQNLQSFLTTAANGGQSADLSPSFPEADSPASSDIFQPLSDGESGSLGSSGAGSPRVESVQDAINRMRRPCEKSPYVWLYDSAREYVDLRQPNPRPSLGNSLSTVDKDPLRILDDYFFVTPIMPENIVSSHLPMPDVTRAQWIIRRVVQSSRLIGNITTVRTMVRPEMSPVDVFSAMVGHFDTFSRFVLQFVRSLPGFDSVCLQDRTRLFIESMFPLLSAQLSLDYDEVSQTPNICGLEPGPGRQLAFNYFYHLGLMEPSMKDAGISMKQARLCVIEFSMICGLLYFNPDVPGLAEPHRVRRIFDEYQRAAEIFIGRNFAMNGSSSAASRIQLFFSQLSYFRSFYRFFSWLLCDFGHHYPSLVSMDPWLSELHGRLSQMSGGVSADSPAPSKSSGATVTAVNPAAIVAATAAAGIPSPFGGVQAPNSNPNSVPSNPVATTPSPISYGLFA